MKRTYIILSAIFLLLCTESKAQEKRATENLDNFKYFAIKLYGGYTSTFEDSKLQIVGGKYDFGNSFTGGGAIEWYYNKNWSVALGTSTGKHTLNMVDGNYSNMEMYRYEMELGSVWMTPINFSARYHITVFDKITPYVLAGGSYVLFHNIDPGWGAEAITYSNIIALHFGAGADYNISKHWFVNTEINTMLTDRSNVDLDFSKYMGWNLKTQLQPNLLKVTLGFGYRF